MHDQIRRTLACCAFALLVCASAAAATFTVNSSADTVDAVPGNGACADAGANCTLRAAVMEANALAGADTIAFTTAMTIRSGNLVVSTPVTIDGRTAAGYAGTPVVRLLTNPELISAFDMLLFQPGSEGSVVDSLIIASSYSAEVRTQSAVTIRRCYLGAVTGAVDEVGASTGVFVESGTATIENSVIGGNGTGIRVDSAASIDGCIIGLRPDGTTPAPNTGVGIRAGRTVSIGESARNVISANGSHGITFGTPNVAGAARIVGNYIGTDATGLLARGNGEHGVVAYSDGGEIRGNVISGNAQHGVYGDANARSVTIRGNIIGLGANGNTVIANGGNGVHLQAGTCVVGGTAAADRNVISGNGGAGVYAGISGVATTILGNYIGTDATGMLPRGNGGAGVENDNSNALQIGARYAYPGDPAAMQGNVISANGGPGVRVSGQYASARLIGNIIGLGADGLLAMGNERAGVTSSGLIAMTIGDATIASARNVISSNGGSGVAITGASPATVVGNRIGTDATGTVARPNMLHGVAISNALQAFIGTRAAAGRNIISGNGGDGIRLDEINYAVIENNYVGTNAAGTAALPNGGRGLAFTGGQLRDGFIGAAAANARNVISGNSGNGLELNLAPAKSVRIEGNFVGTAADGLGAIANGGHGISITAGATSTGLFIGGTAAGAGNLIAHNVGSGIVHGGAAGTSIFGNTVRNNTAGGISITSSGTLIGGTDAGQANTVAANNPFGIVVADGATANRISGNSIYGHSGLPIDLLPAAGVTPNDPGDPDSGGNLLQNFPQLATARTYPASPATITGSLNSTPDTAFALEFFSDTGADPEARTYLGTANVTTDGTGNVTFATPLAAPAAGSRITATATDPAGNTSELSAPIVLTQPGVLSLGSAVYSFDENAGTATFTVNRTGGSDGSVTVAWSAAGSSATSGVDYTGTGGTLTFGPGVTTQTFSVALVNDNIDESDETFTITLSNTTNGALLGTTTSSTATIVDDDGAPGITITGTSGSEAAAKLTFTVTLSNPSAVPVTVNYATANGTAVAGSDYTATTGMLTFTPGTLVQTIDVPLLNETTFEPNETFTVTLSGASGASIATPTATGTILNDDGAPSLAISDTSASEAAANATFTVTLSASSAVPVTVNYSTANGTAVAGSDYTTTTGMLTFAPGTLVQTISVPLLNDTTLEPNETFTVTLSGASGALIASSTATATIVNDDSTADLAITKNGPASVVPQGRAEYTITVTNQGPGSASNVVIVDALPAGLTLDSATPTQGTCSGTSTITCSAGMLANGATTTITIRTRVTASSGTITNSASVTAAEVDPNPANGSASAAATVVTSAIPTLSEWALLLFGALLVLVAVRRI